MVSAICRACYETSLGTLTIAADSGAVTGVYFGDRPVTGSREGRNALTDWADREIREYLAGERRDFTVPLKILRGTPFQRQVWEALRRIPYGEVCSYGDLARAIGRPRACRAVGMANHQNPISILIPCHRVVGADGSLTGYGGGLERKQALINLERTVVRE